MKNIIDFNCPKCGSENIRKFSSIYRDGLSDLAGRNFYGTSQTVSSQIASPPFSPSQFLRRCCFFIIPLLFLGHIGRSPVFFTVGILLGVICAIACRIYASTIYRDSLQIWNNTYLCQRCDSAFILGQDAPQDDW
jgi:hypothetical protein